MLDRNALKAEFVRNGMTQQEVAEAIAMPLRTFVYKLANDSFTISEANAIIKALNIEEPGRIFFADEVKCDFTRNCTQLHAETATEVST